MYTHDCTDRKTISKLMRENTKQSVQLCRKKRKDIDHFLDGRLLK